MLSDGSQMRKNDNEKEVVLVRVENFGISGYFVVLLLDMATFGGTNADTLKKVWTLCLKQGMFLLKIIKQNL